MGVQHSCPNLLLVGTGVTEFHVIDFWNCFWWLLKLHAQAGGLLFLHVYDTLLKLFLVATETTCTSNRIAFFFFYMYSYIVTWGEASREGGYIDTPLLRKIITSLIDLCWLVLRVKENLICPRSNMLVITPCTCTKGKAISFVCLLSVVV